MREIKFRLWNLKNKYMFSNDNEELLLNIDGSSLWGHKIHYYDGTDLLEIDDFAIMQYTGLKDKKGVEIYEGDILFHPLQGRRMVYYPYSERVASYGLRDIDNGFGSTLQDSHAVWEVIGNIYENKDLLED